MTSERLELVTDEAAINVGDLLVLKGCDWCGSNHRFMMLANVPARMYSVGSSGHQETNPPGARAWRLAPMPICISRAGSDEVVIRDAVNIRRLFRVILDDAAGETETVGRKVEVGA